MGDEKVNQKEQHRLGTINRWDPPEGDWAAEFDWTRYRGPPPWPVPGGWVFKDPEEGGWWEYFGETGVGQYFDDTILEAFQDGESVDDAHEALADAREDTYAYLSTETANPDEVSLRNPEDEKIEWALEVDGTEVFRRVEPDRPDLMAAVAEALAAYHEGALEERVDEIVPSSGQKPESERRAEERERRAEENQHLGQFAGGGDGV